MAKPEATDTGNSLKPEMVIEFEKQRLSGVQSRKIRFFFFFKKILIFVVRGFLWSKTVDD